MKLGKDSKLLFSTAVVIVVALVGSWFALDQAREAILQKEGTTAAVRWARYLENNLRGLDNLLEAGLIADEDRIVLDLPTATGSVWNYQILDANGAVAYSSGSGDFRRDGSNDLAMAVIRDGRVHTELTRADPSGSGPHLIAEAYVPIKSAGGQNGVVGLKIDLSERGVELTRRGLFAFLGLLAFVLLISSLCGVLVRRNMRNRRWAEEIQSSRNVVLEQLATGTPLEQILLTLVRSVERLKPDTVCSIFLLDEAGPCLKDIAFPGSQNSYRHAIEGIEIGPDFTSRCAAAHTRQLVTNPENLNEGYRDHLRNVILRSDLCACWSRPIISSSDEVLGTIALHHRGSREPTEADLEFFRTISHLVGIAVEQRRFQAKIAHLAHFDTLTGLPNRRELQTRLQQFVDEAQRANTTMALAIIDIDKFKTINDTYGHPVGDEVIREAARRLCKCVREDDVVGRLGGDELAIVFKEVSSVREIALISERIAASIRAPMQIDGKSIVTSGSIGVSCFPQHASDADELFIKADHALYQAKQSGRDTYQIYDEKLHELIRENQNLERDAALGIQRGEFSLVYQPQIDLRSGAIVGIEALARWQHPSLGEIPPSKFIPIAESSTIIIELGERFLREACGQAARWREKGLLDARVDVNVAARQFKDPRFIDKIKTILDEVRLEPSALGLEITETLLIDDLKVVEKTLEELNRLGVSVSIDDFGTGYSSLLYLARLPFQTLKIDGSFVRNLPSDCNSVAIVTSIIAMARQLGLSVVAEGIETHEQANFLRENDCSAGQGYLLARPMTAPQLEQWLREDFIGQTQFGRLSSRHLEAAGTGSALAQRM